MRIRVDAITGDVLDFSPKPVHIEIDSKYADPSWEEYRIYVALRGKDYRDRTWGINYQGKQTSTSSAEGKGDFFYWEDSTFYVGYFTWEAKLID